MSDVKLIDANSLKVGGYLIIDGVACVAKRIDTSKTGKHGHAKCRIEAAGLVNNEKKIIIKTSHDKIEVPIVEKKSAQVLSVSADSANVMDSETFETFDIKIPEELKGKIKEGHQISYWTILGQKVMRE
ncbi:translation initiation factor IF-5A [Candidatus Woesearchaeota archaeon]|nr:translation initiation factor IF-5A [Candidatus Woesearchaeota archaeon]